MAKGKVSTKGVEAALKKAALAAKKNVEQQKKSLPSRQKSTAKKKSNKLGGLSSFSLEPSRQWKKIDIKQSLAQIKKEGEMRKTAVKKETPAPRDSFGKRTSFHGSQFKDIAGKTAASIGQKVLTAVEEKKSYLPVGDFRISSRFGVDRGDHRHSGIDLAIPEGTSVASVKKGTVTFAGWSNGYGYRVVVDHGDGSQSTYNHLSDIGVKAGDKVNAGSQIALSGNTGRSTGPHLHFEMKIGGKYVDPESYYDFGNGIVAPKDSNYTSQLAAASGSTKHSSSSSSKGKTKSAAKGKKKSAAGEIASVALPMAKTEGNQDYFDAKALLNQMAADKNFSRREPQKDDFISPQKNALLDLIPIYSEIYKIGRSKRTSGTKRS